MNAKTLNDHWLGAFGVDNKEDRFKMPNNPRWVYERALSSPAAMAIEHIRLHVIDTTKINSQKNTDEHYIGYMELTPTSHRVTDRLDLPMTVSAAKLNGETITGTGNAIYKRFVIELDRLKEEKYAQFFYYLSIKISQRFVDLYPNSEQWERGGWAFPAEFSFDEDRNVMEFTRFEGEHNGEIPDFDWFRKVSDSSNRKIAHLPFYEYLAKDEMKR